MASTFPFFIGSDTPATQKGTSLWRVRRVLLGLLIWLVIFSGTAAWWLSGEADRLEHHFRQQAEVFYQQLSQPLDQNETVLLSLELLLRATPARPATELHRYARQMLQRYPHLDAIQLYQSTSYRQLPELLSDMQQQGYPHFAVQERSPLADQALRAAGARGLYLPLVMTEPPRSDPESQMGFDLLSDKQRFDALDITLKNGYAISTPPYLLARGGQGYLLMKAFTVEGASNVHTPPMVLAIQVRNDKLMAGLVNVVGERLDAKLTFYLNGSQGRNRLFFNQRMQATSAWESRLLPQFEYARPIVSIAQPLELQLAMQMQWQDVSLEALFYLAISLLMLVGFGMLAYHQREQAHLENQQGKLRLEQERELAALTLQHIYDGVIRIDKLGRIAYMNPMAAHLLNVSAEKVLGDSIFTLFRIHFDMAERLHDNPINQCLNSGQAVEFPENTLLSTTVVKPMQIEGSVTPLPFYREIELGALITFRNIGPTHNKVLARLSDSQKRVREHEEKLAHVARLNLMGEMASGIAHEINQPLSAIGNYNQACLRLLEDDPLDLDVIRRAMTSAAQQAQRAGDILQRLRAFVSKQPAQPEQISLAQVVHNTLTLAEHLLKENKVRTVLQLDERLPPIMADAIQIEQVVLNLISNAVDSLSQQTQERWLKLATKIDGAGVVLTVTDNGGGIPARILDNLFTPFITSKPHGMGLGLTICQSIIEAHQGRITAKNLAEGGACFSIYLPLSGDTAANSPRFNLKDATA